MRIVVRTACLKGSTVRIVVFAQSIVFFLSSPRGFRRSSPADRRRVQGSKGHVASERWAHLNFPGSLCGVFFTLFTNSCLYLFICDRRDEARDLIS